MEDLDRDALRDLLIDLEYFMVSSEDIFAGDTEFEDLHARLQGVLRTVLGY